MTMKNAITNVTGSGGTAPVKDGTARGSFSVVLTAAVGIAAIAFDADKSIIVLLTSGSAGLAFLLGGVWDKFFKAQ